MKLYATVKSERASRTVKKGGNNYIRITFTSGNEQRFEVVMTEYDLSVLNYGNGETSFIKYAN